MAKEYMTKADIENKLKLLKTDNAKFGYLKQLSKKAGVLKPETRKEFYELMGDYAVKEGRPDDATDAYKKAGSEKGLIKVGDKCVEEGRFDDATNAYEKAGLKLSKEQFSRLGYKAIERGRFNDAAKAYEKARSKKGLIKVGDKSLKKDRFYHAAEVYEKLGFASGTKEQMEDLADAYEWMGKGKEALKLRKKLAK